MKRGFQLKNVYMSGSEGNYMLHLIQEPHCVTFIIYNPQGKVIQIESNKIG